MVDRVLILLVLFLLSHHTCTTVCHQMWEVVTYFAVIQAVFLPVHRSDDEILTDTSEVDMDADWHEEEKKLQVVAWRIGLHIYPFVETHDSIC